MILYSVNAQEKTFIILVNYEYLSEIQGEEN